MVKGRWERVAFDFPLLNTCMGRITLDDSPSCAILDKEWLVRPSKNQVLL